ncbi:MAG: hypothetical protein JO359_07490 [Candidatus Eremiobacteraeota bacterium]|nr:hypothetical protein [Candidatus Eremiobacteraeota bacterium]
MRIHLGLLVPALFAVAVTGCGGGGGSSSPSVLPTSNPTQAPTQSPTQAPGPVLQTATLAGGSGFVAPSGLTVYVLSADSFNNSTCFASNGCTGIWPVVTVPSGAHMANGFSSFPRPDGLTQLAFNGNPLYTYAGDSGAGQTNGNGIHSFGGVWSIARPGMANAPGVPAPTSTPGGNGGY